MPLNRKRIDLDRGFDIEAEQSQLSGPTRSTANTAFRSRSRTNLMSLGSCRSTKSAAVRFCIAAMWNAW